MFKRFLFSVSPSNAITAIGLLVLRLGFGGTMLLAHGAGKAGSFNETAANFPDPLGVGSVVSMLLVIFAEAVCSSLLVVGFMTRLAAIPLMITMGVAMLIIHALDPFQVKELAFVYGIGFLTIFLAGPGWISLDAWFGRK